MEFYVDWLIIQWQIDLDSEFSDVNQTKQVSKPIKAANNLAFVILALDNLGQFFSEYCVTFLLHWQTYFAFCQKSLEMFGYGQFLHIFERL